MNISFQDIGCQAVTFPAGTAQAGQVCKLASDGKAASCAAGDVFCGVVESVRCGCAGVQIHGFAQVRYTGTAPALGYVNLTANGSGGVKVDSAGRSYLTVQVDTANTTVTIEL